MLLEPTTKVLQRKRWNLIERMGTETLHSHPKLADPREWPRSHAIFNWPIKSISFPRFAVHRTWTRSRLYNSFRTVLLSTTIQLNVSVTLIWMIKYVQSLLGLSFPTWKAFTGITNYLPYMKMLKLMNHMRTGGLQSFKVNVRPSSLIMSWNAFLHDKKRQSADNASNIVRAGWCLFIGKTLRKRAYLLQNLTRKMITRTRALKVNKPTVEWTF